MLLSSQTLVSAVLFNPTDDALCPDAGIYVGCPNVKASTNGGGVDLDGSVQRQRAGTPAAGVPGGSGGKARIPSRDGESDALTDAEILRLEEQICTGVGTCGGRFAVLGEPPEEGKDVPAQVVTIADLARFLPAVAALHGEPDGWAVVGVPANFWVDVEAVTVAGELLGEAAEVRFTPQAYRFDYGDGTTRATTTPGASWADLGQEELTKTQTSHIYEARADREATVTVVYSAEYRFAGGAWIGVAGAVSGTTPPQRVLVVVERTALTTPA